MPKLEYRADIDGLRAVAVVLVILFHAFPSFLSGGYLGVDVFFVISGFLITSIILKKGGGFSYRDFYYRRCRRIMPALVTVLFATWFAGWMLLFPSEYSQLCRHILTGIGFSSNIQLWSETGYFNAANEAKPLLHLWSLGIEEQFYILWPVLLILFKRKTWVIFGLWAASIFCFICLDPDSSFYMLHCRAWQLLSGCALAFGKTKLNVHYSYLGLSLIAIAVCVHSNVLATLGTVLIISAPGNRILTYKPMVNITD